MIKIRVLICGDRNWNNFKVIEEFILSLPKGSIIIEGDCRGADKISGYLGRKHGFVVIPYPADWKKYGDAAGPIRNKQMIDEGKPDLVVAFHNSIESSKGTKNMINQAKKANIPVKIIKEEEMKIVIIPPSYVDETFPEQLCGWRHDPKIDCLLCFIKLCEHRDAINEYEG